MVGVFRKRGNFAARIVAAVLAAVLCVSSVPCAAFAQAASNVDAQSVSGAALREACASEGTGEGAGAAGIGAAGAGTNGEVADGADCIGAGGVVSGDADEDSADTDAAVGVDNASTFAASAERQPLSSASAGLNETRDFATQALEARTSAAVQYRNDRIALASANYDYSGMAHCWFRN